MDKKKIIKDILQIAAILLLIAYLLKALITDIYLIPSVSMLPSLKRNDLVLVSRIEYGFRSPAIWPVFGSSFPEFSLFDVEPAFGEVIVANLPGSNYPIAKRIAALPGDSVCFGRGEFYFFRNGAYFHYVKNKIYEITKFPDNLEKYFVPKRGSQILITRKNIDFYKKEPELESKIFLKLDKNNFQKEIKIITDSDYFFLMGDNRDNSFDSRNFGLVPMKSIAGKCLLILWPADFSEFDKRFLKLIK